MCGTYANRCKSISPNLKFQVINKASSAVTCDLIYDGKYVGLIFLSKPGLERPKVVSRGGYLYAVPSTVIPNPYKSFPHSFGCHEHD